MGVTIHYRGRAKNPDAIFELIQIMRARAILKRWPYELIDETYKGTFHPFWGYGLVYVPTSEQIEKDHIEFFPKMVSVRCNGYYSIWDTKYAEALRAAFRDGNEPTFSIDTRTKGIRLIPHEDCEPLDFVFDLSTLELAHYTRLPNTSRAIYGYNTFWCKTQFAGFRTHLEVCATIKLAEQCIDFTEINDEANFYHTHDLALAKKNFDVMEKMIKVFGEALKEMGRAEGLTVVTGYEM